MLPQFYQVKKSNNPYAVTVKCTVQYHAVLEHT
jgi:hypothetical protein